MDVEKKLDPIRARLESRKASVREDYGVKGMKWGEHNAQEPETSNADRTVMDNILPDNGQLERFDRIQLLMEVLIDELRSVAADVEELARDSEVVDAFLASSVIERNRK